MKRNLFIIISIVCILINACTDKEAIDISTDIYLFIDVTDEIYQDKALFYNGIPQLLKKMHLSTENGGLSGGTIKFFLLNETSASPFKTITIEKGTDSPFSDRSNEFVRAEEVQKFSKEVYAVFDEILSMEEWGKSNSKIYQQLCREIGILSKLSQAEEKVVIIYSDMLEHSKLFSFYGSSIEQIKRWMLSKENIEKAYENILSIDCKLSGADFDLSEIEIYITSKRDKTNDEKINLANKFWSSIFEINKAEAIHFGAELRVY